MASLKDIAAHYIKNGEIVSLLCFTAASGYELTEDEAEAAFIAKTERKENDTYEHLVTQLPARAREVELPEKALESFAWGAWGGCYSFEIGFRIARELCKLHSNPKPILSELISQITEMGEFPEICEEAYEVVEEGVSEEAYKKYLEQCIDTGFLELAKKTKQLKSEKLTTEECERIIGRNLCFYSDVKGACLAAKEAGRELTEEELEKYLDRCINGDFGDKNDDEAFEALRRLKRTFTQKELDSLASWVIK